MTEDYSILKYKDKAMNTIRVHKKGLKCNDRINQSM